MMTPNFVVCLFKSYILINNNNNISRDDYLEPRNYMNVIARTSATVPTYSHFMSDPYELIEFTNGIELHSTSAAADLIVKFSNSDLIFLINQVIALV